MRASSYFVLNRLLQVQNETLLNPPTRRNRVQRITSRSISEEIPIPVPQQQYVMTGSALADKRSASTSNDMAFLNPDMVKSCSILKIVNPNFFYRHLILRHHQHLVVDIMLKLNVVEISR